MESAELFARGVGLAVYSLIWDFRDGALPQFGGMVLREPAQFTRRAGIVWAALTGAPCGLRGRRRHRFGFQPWVVGAARRFGTAVLFLPALGGMGFLWKRASWCRVGMAALCVYVALAAAAHRSAVAHTEEFAAARHCTWTILRRSRCRRR